MLLSDKTEFARLGARKKFEEFAHNLTKPGGSIEKVDAYRKARIVSMLNETLKMKTGRREQYDDIVRQVKDIIANKSSFQKSKVSRKTYLLNLS